MIEWFLSPWDLKHVCHSRNSILMSYFATADPPFNKLSHSQCRCLALPCVLRFPWDSLIFKCFTCHRPFTRERNWFSPAFSHELWFMSDGNNKKSYSILEHNSVLCKGSIFWIAHFWTQVCTHCTQTSSFWRLCSKTSFAPGALYGTSSLTPSGYIPPSGNSDMKSWQP